MRHAVTIGIAGGAAFSVWSVVTMLWPVSFGVWDVGRSVLFLAFFVALTGLARSVANAGRSLGRTFWHTAVAALIGAGIALTTYAVSTRFFADRIVQLPEYVRDYTHHGYTSPEAYLATNYSALLELQVFSWAIGATGLLIVAGTAGWWLNRSEARRAD